MNNTSIAIALLSIAIIINSIEGIIHDLDIHEIKKEISLLNYQVNVITETISK